MPYGAFTSGSWMNCRLAGKDLSSQAVIPLAHNWATSSVQPRQLSSRALYALYCELKVLNKMLKIGGHILLRREYSIWKAKLVYAPIFDCSLHWPLMCHPMLSSYVSIDLCYASHLRYAEKTIMLCKLMRDSLALDPPADILVGPLTSSALLAEPSACWAQ